MKSIKINFSFFSSLFLQKLPITTFEENCLQKLNPQKALEYRYSRGKLRNFLSPILEIPSLEIPISAPPGRPPKLKEGFGYVSISHSKNALLIGWSEHPLGVDIEHSDRKIKADEIIKRFYTENEQIELKNFSGEDLRKKCLDLWVIKESSIKSIYGTIFQDLDNWEFSKINNTSFNKKIGLKRKIFLKEIDKYKIGIAYDLKVDESNFFISRN